MIRERDTPTADLVELRGAMSRLVHGARLVTHAHRHRAYQGLHRCDSSTCLPLVREVRVRPLRLVDDDLEWALHGAPLPGHATRANKISNGPPSPRHQPRRCRSQSPSQTHDTETRARGQQPGIPGTGSNIILGFRRQRTKPNR